MTDDEYATAKRERDEALGALEGGPELVELPELDWSWPTGVNAYYARCSLTWRWKRR